MIETSQLTGRMRVVCSWCKPPRQTGTKPCPPSMDGHTTHGICEACKAEVLGGQAGLVGAMVEIGATKLRRPEFHS